MNLCGEHQMPKDCVCETCADNVPICMICFRNSHCKHVFNALSVGDQALVLPTCGVKRQLPVSLVSQQQISVVTPKKARQTPSSKLSDTQNIPKNSKTQKEQSASHKRACEPRKSSVALVDKTSSANTSVVQNNKVSTELDEDWLESFNELKKFIHIHFSLSLLYDSDENSCAASRMSEFDNLKDWINNQIFEHENNTLAPKKRELLQQLVNKEQFFWDINQFYVDNRSGTVASTSASGAVNGGAAVGSNTEVTTYDHGVSKVPSTVTTVARRGKQPKSPPSHWRQVTSAAQRVSVTALCGSSDDGDSGQQFVVHGKAAAPPPSQESDKCRSHSLATPKSAPPAAREIRVKRTVQDLKTTGVAVASEVGTKDMEPMDAEPITDNNAATASTTMNLDTSHPAAEVPTAVNTITECDTTSRGSKAGGRKPRTKQTTANPAPTQEKLFISEAEQYSGPKSKLRANDIWWRNYYLVLAYKEHHGTFDVPLTEIVFTEDGTGPPVPLGAWLKQQKDTLSGMNFERYSALEQLAETGLLWCDADVSATSGHTSNAASVTSTAVTTTATAIAGTSSGAASATPHTTTETTTALSSAHEQGSASGGGVWAVSEVPSRRDNMHNNSSSGNVNTSTISDSSSSSDSSESSEQQPKSFFRYISATSSDRASSGLTPPSTHSSDSDYFFDESTTHEEQPNLLSETAPPPNRKRGRPAVRSSTGSAKSGRIRKSPRNSSGDMGVKTRTRSSAKHNVNSRADTAMASVRATSAGGSSRRALQSTKQSRLAEHDVHLGAGESGETGNDFAQRSLTGTVSTGTDALSHQNKSDCVTSSSRSIGARKPNWRNMVVQPLHMNVEQQPQQQEQQQQQSKSEERVIQKTPDIDATALPVDSSYIQSSATNSSPSTRSQVTKPRATATLNDFIKLSKPASTKIDHKTGTIGTTIPVPEVLPSGMFVAYLYAKSKQEENCVGVGKITGVRTVNTRSVVGSDTNNSSSGKKESSVGANKINTFPALLYDITLYNAVQPTSRGGSPVGHNTVTNSGGSGSSGLGVPKTTTASSSGFEIGVFKASKVSHVVPRNRILLTDLTLLDGKLVRTDVRKLNKIVTELHL